MTFLQLVALNPALAVVVALFAGGIGAVFGSFINCVAWRLAHGENPWKGRSHCATCGHELGVLDLVPVLSWLMLRGTCRYCGEKVAFRYIAAELICGLFFISVVLVRGLTFEAPFICALGVVLLGLSLVDAETFTIPNGFVIAGILVWAVYVTALFAMGNPTVADVALSSLMGGLAIGGGVLVVSLIMDKVLNKPSMGGGDIKLLFVVGLFLGPAVGLLNLIVSCVVGLVFAIAVSRKADAEAPVQGAFPFGPSICIAAWFSLLFGDSIVQMYLSLFL